MTQEQRENLEVAAAAESEMTVALVELSDSQLAAMMALKVEKNERELFAAKAVNTALKSGIGSKITSVVKKVYDEERKGNAGNVTKLRATLRELELIAEKL